MFFNNTLRKVSYGLKSRSNREITLLHTIFLAKEFDSQKKFYFRPPMLGFISDRMSKSLISRPQVIFSGEQSSIFFVFPKSHSRRI